jgi:outer membrane receptor for ferrienterochelin and colicins
MILLFRKRKLLMFYLILIFIIIPSFYTNSLFSQNTNEKDQGTLETNKPSPPAVEEKPIIVVTGSRREQRLKDSTSMTEVISKKRIEQTGARNLGEVLQGQLGVDVVPFFGGSRVRMLGMDSQYVLFLVDSERIAGRLDNAVDLTRFKTQNIERIEIVKGSSSALYGADAMGGVINMITRETEKDQEYNLRTTYGNGRKKFIHRSGKCKNYNWNEQL